MQPNHILVLSCEDRPGIVAAVASVLAADAGNIVEAHQYNDDETRRFFMRVEFSSPLSTAQLRERFGTTGSQFGMSWRIRPCDERKKVLILVSKFDHCLRDLVYRASTGDLPMDVAAIVSNHPMDTLGDALPDDTPFFHCPMTDEGKQAQEAQVLALVNDAGADLVILARYMQILSEPMSRALSGRCINIHHSFLPGFKGARPYHQAHARGVKMIGATAHYVTGDLDEGPIIVQDVEPVSHAENVDELVRKGRDIERRVLARAVRFHLEDRVLLNGQKTVVFPH